MATHVVARGNTETIQWGAALSAGILAMLAFIALQTAFAWALKGESPWTPLHMIGATVLGPGALAAPNSADSRFVAVAGSILLAIALFSGVILALIVRRLDVTSALVVGALFALAAYYVDVYGLTVRFPWFADWRDWTSVLAYVVQGALTAGLYKAATRSVRDAAHEPAVERPARDLRQMRNVPLM